MNVIRTKKYADKAKVVASTIYSIIIDFILLHMCGRFKT